MNVKKLFPAWVFSQLGLILALVLGLLIFVFFKGIDLSVINPKWKFESGSEIIKKTFSTAPIGGYKASELSTDVTHAVFSEYRSYIGARESISIHIVDTTTEFSVESSPGTEPGTGEFVVTPRQFQWSTTDIESLVRSGLDSVPSGSEPSLRPRWSGYSIATNKAERVWVVKMRGLGGEGKIRLDIGTATAYLDVHLPRPLPIWKYVSFVDPRSGIVVVGGHDLKVGDVISPDPVHDISGVAVHSISNRSVWFEVVNTVPNPALRRTRWPDVHIDYQELDNGQSLSKIVFESGHTMVAGDKAVFDEQGDALKLEPNSFLSERAVRLRYLDRHDDLIADMIVVTFLPN